VAYRVGCSQKLLGSPLSGSGLATGERRRAQSLIDRLSLSETTREAATRAVRCQTGWARRGHTLQTPDALIAGTARAHGSVLVTDNLDDFPMRDIRVEQPVASNERSNSLIDFLISSGRYWNFQELRKRLSDAARLLATE